MNKPAESHHYLHSFCVSPTTKFDGQNDGEILILRLRAHPITQIYWLINTIILALTLFLINFLLANLFSIAQMIFFNLFAIGIVFGYFWFNLIGWFFNVGIVTNQRIIDIDLHSILYKEVTMAIIGKIEDVTSKSGGFFSSVFNYGNVFVQTAGSEANVEFMNIPKPSDAAKIINSLLPK